jgi:undecaprenyl-diphosphatase
MADPRARRDGDLLRDPRRGAWAATVMLVAAAGLTILVVADIAAPPGLADLDAWWRDLIEPSDAWAERVSEWLYVVGGGAVMAPLRIGVAAWLAVRRRWVDLAAWLGAWAVADLVTQMLKAGVGRTRPDLTNAASFPSGHAKSAAQVAIGLVLIATSPWRPRAWAWAAALAWILAMCLSRTILADHYLSDVVAGSLLGAGCALGVAGLAQMGRDRRLARGTPPDRD